MSEQIKVTIDGKELAGRAGQSVLDLALSNGIEIPNLCHDPRLTPTGSCRLCLVEVEGQTQPTASCTLEVQPGMVVRTETDQVNSIRRTILELLFYEHCGSCTTCDENGQCRLQSYAYDYKLDVESLDQGSYAKPEPNYTTGNLALEYDPRKCIRCGRCVRICDEVQMAHALTFKNRAAETEVTTAFDLPLNESTCVLCGQCISTCPTGALYDRSAIGEGQAKDLVRTRTTCIYCGVGCQIDLNVNPKKNRIVRVTSEVGCIPNDGNLCVKGRFGMDFVGHPERLTTPLIRRNGKLEEATWDEAISLIAKKLMKIKPESGPDSIAGLSSAKCTNEDNYVFQKFIRAVIGTNNVDHCARLCHSSTVAGLARAFGSGAMTNSIDEFKNARCILVIGSNTPEAHPVIALGIREAAVKNRAELIIADPREIELVRYAKLHLQQQPGSDVALINAMMNVILEEGLHDRDFIEQRTEGFDEIIEAIKEMTPEKAEKITTVPADSIREAARTYAKADSASIVFSMGITQHTTGTDNVLSLANLAMLTGNVGKESAGVNPLRGQNNVQGACDLGALPNVYPGYQSVEDAEIHAKFEKAWGAKLSDKTGLTVVEMFHAIEDGDVRALYLMGENPALSDPNLNRTLRALQKVEFLVSQDVFLSESGQYADVVLPAFSFAEKEGTFTNTERRIQRVRKAVKPPGQTRDDWRILCDIATAMGTPMQYENASQIMDEIASVTPIYGGIAYDRIESLGLQWPCLDRDHRGTKYLHKGEFKRGKGKFHPVRFRAPAELPDKDYPMILSTGRQLYQYHTGTLSRRSPSIDQKSPTGYVEIHFKDAKEYGIEDGDSVEITTTRGKVTTKASVGTRVARGWLFMPFHFAEGPANMLTNDALDPIAKIPEFKVCAAKIKAL
ncbi:MAG: formate dehydrogenase subunit alpha [Phycisphaerales bacterium]|nr:MAG: formate dehydrogenase subunit alpha [Phycisphaerales bacterium]